LVPLYLGYYLPFVDRAPRSSQRALLSISLHASDPTWASVSMAPARPSGGERASCPLGCMVPGGSSIVVGLALGLVPPTPWWGGPSASFICAHSGAKPWHQCDLQPLGSTCLVRAVRECVVLSDSPSCPPCAPQQQCTYVLAPHHTAEKAWHRANSGHIRVQVQLQQHRQPRGARASRCCWQRTAGPSVRS
jgi:hypothetical protein